MLNGRTILVVEAEFLIALDIQRMLEELGAGQMLFARTAEEAHGLAETWSALELAIVEVRFDRPLSLALAQSLRMAGVPVVVSSASSTIRTGHPDIPDAPVIVKPMVEEDFALAIGTALTSRAQNE